MAVNPLFARPGEETVPRWRIPDGEMLPDMAYQIIHDELLLDGNARQNLATFVSTWMEPQADAALRRVVRQEHDRQGRVPADRGDRGTVHPHPRRPLERARAAHDDRYVGDRIVRGVHARPGSRSNGGGSSARKAEKKSTDAPNIVFSSAVQVVWEKFANYWEVEPRYVPITKDKPYLTPEGMLEVVDENTIGVVPILGVTYNGVYEPVKELAAALDDLARAHRARHPAARRRSVGRVHRSVPRSRSRVGLPPAPGALDQHVGTQVRARVPGSRLGRVGEAASTCPRS